MKTISYTGAFELITIGMGPGEMLLEGIEEAIKKHDIRNGIVLSGIGTFKRCRLHYITTTDLPPLDSILVLEKPLELNSINGIIADGEPHLHIGVTGKEGEAYGGHLEPGSELAYLAEITILKCNAHALVRRPGPSGYLKLLQAAAEETGSVA